MTIEDWHSITHFFSNKLSKQLIFNHIYTYAYETQPQYLLEDVKSFSSRYEEVEKIYKEIFTAHQFWNDIYNFLIQEKPPVGYFHNGVPYRGVCFAATVIKRMYGLKNVSVEIICNYNNNIFFRYGLSLLNMNPDSKQLHRLCKKFFALLTPDERMDFMENWIDRNAPPREEYIQGWEIENNNNTEWEIENNNITEWSEATMDSYLYMADY